ncbi:Phosphoribosylformylglycinamidine synthase, synthetase subunit [Rubellimicrobium mesophilum DSM 19309]|uniref:Phosphoribosylformylglycinamidine synthase subunit PurL n=1 Tax=Rubellimicrobium mesophilum DSM 19309 TaxID=442562 RepID=A0A017HR61_9RHOB|nr:phosphoribosylformylglycinamidine synthase subunit PurL [Rubellimicrobium mesophilum]EYD76249.1 Phosphoribosylformylglycinamidine synthase, synthetase subunit [Rubellimicrobium mesophilum DSM 19309]
MEPEITPDLVAAHGIKPDEYERLLGIIGRTPTFTELGIFSAMWNEHCSYKSSKKWLRTLPTTGPQVICGPGENAGVVDLGDGDALVFKMESHNHPSYIEPYQGAATGVGGILRDVFTMGARPIAAMNALSFGEVSHPKTKRLIAGVVEGVGGYGNAFGVPTVGGEVRFHRAYNGNCLVNAFAAGLARTDAIFYSAASGVGMPVVYLGAKTGRDGVGGATMASAEFDETIEEKRPTVQVGDPFTEKRLLEACMELMASGAVISIQDMGAAGLTCSAVEMGDKGGLGIRLDLDRVPVREVGMTAYEMMLSESQERMLMVLKPEKEVEARAIFEKWDLDFAIVGETIPEDRFLIMLGNEVKADLPLSQLSSSAPEYDRPWVPSPAPAALPAVPEIGAVDALKRLLADPNHANKAWVWEQYDSQVGGDTVRRPGLGAGIVRVHGTGKAVAFTSDVTPRYVKANPVEGGRQAVAEAWRNLVAVGARPLAATDNLNFGNPEKPEIMGQLVGAVQGIGEACRALDFPIVSGNVSLYNETDGSGILPTPTIGGVGLLRSLDEVIAGPARDGDVLVLVGETRGHLGQSALLACLGVEAGEAPPVDLSSERRNGEFVLRVRPLIRAATDLGDGGLALAAFELAQAAGQGATLEASDVPTLFGEDQARYLLAVATENAEGLLAAAGEDAIPAAIVGRVGGTELRLGGEATPMEELVRLWRTAFAEAVA